MWPLSFMDDELQWHSGIIFHSNHGTDCFLETKTLFNWNLSNECVIDLDNSKNGWSEYFCYKDHQYSFMAQIEVHKTDFSSIVKYSICWKYPLPHDYETTGMRQPKKQGWGGGEKEAQMFFLVPEKNEEDFNLQMSPKYFDLISIHHTCCSMRVNWAFLASNNVLLKLMMAGH